MCLIAPIQCTRNENLAIELLNLVNNKAALMKQVTILTNGDPAHIDDPNKEIQRVRAIVNQNSSGKVKVHAFHYFEVTPFCYDQVQYVW